MPTSADLERLRRHARRLDSQFGIPFTPWRWGIESVVGLVPGIGDTLGAGLSLWIPYQAWRMGARRGTLARMLGNVGVDALVGTVPLFGDLFDIAFKANERNVRLFERDVEAPGGPAARIPESSEVGV